MLNCEHAYCGIRSGERFKDLGGRALLSHHILKGTFLEAQRVTICLSVAAGHVWFGLVGLVFFYVWCLVFDVWCLVFEMWLVSWKLLIAVALR